ncbi:hypothetical protein DFH06DRAFT_1417377 [Mycena polygramma]|nr:hypothetical protein DFH06DRAFT_1417377 [Mycena polygramma]
MGNRKIDDGVKRVALRLLARGRDSREEIAQLCDFSTRTLTRRTIRRMRLTGGVARAKANGWGRPRILHPHDVRFLLRLAKHQPCRFLDEYQSLLDKYRQMPVSMATIHRTFARAGLNVKRVQKMASERSILAEGDFIQRISQYPAHYLVPLDEMSKDDRTYARLYGRSAVGERCEVYPPLLSEKRPVARDESISRTS